MTLLLLLGGTGTPVPTQAGSLTQPGETFEIAFGYTWSDPDPQWTDVTAWVGDDWSTNSGRSDEIQSFAASTLAFTLDNKDRRFDPAYVDGPYYGDILPVVPVRVTAWWDGLSYPVFYGFIEGWPQTYTIGDQIADTDVTANDVLELLTQVDYSAGTWTIDDPVLGLLDSGNVVGGDGELPAMTSGERVNTILDLVHWPTSRRLIATGVAMVPPDPVDGTAREELQKMEWAEAGALYQDPSGVVTFLDRHAEWNEARMATSQASFSDADLAMPYAGLSFSYDRAYVYNDVRRGREDGPVQIAQDPTSISRFFRRKHEITDLALVADADAAALAGQFLFRHKDPTLRPEPLTIDPGNNRAALWPQVLGRKLQDRISLERTPQAIGDPISEDFRIEGIQHQRSGKKWLTTWALSPVDDSTYWTLDDPALGLLDAGNLIGA